MDRRAVAGPLGLCESGVGRRLQAVDDRQHLVHPAARNEINRPLPTHVAMGTEQPDPGLVGIVHLAELVREPFEPQEPGQAVRPWRGPAGSPARYRLRRGLQKLRDLSRGDAARLLDACRAFDLRLFPRMPLFHRSSGPLRRTCERQSTRDGLRPTAGQVADSRDVPAGTSLGDGHADFVATIATAPRTFDLGAWLSGKRVTSRFHLTRTHSSSDWSRWGTTVPRAKSCGTGCACWRKRSTEGSSRSGSTRG